MGRWRARMSLAEGEAHTQGQRAGRLPLLGRDGGFNIALELAGHCLGCLPLLSCGWLFHTITVHLHGSF